MSVREFRPSLQVKSDKELLIGQYLTGVKLDRSMIITAQELKIKFLKSLDADISDQLISEFVKLDKEINLENFVRFFVEMQLDLEKRIEMLQSEMKDTYVKLEETRKRIVMNKATESYNEQGIMNGSVLTVYVLEGQNLSKNDNKLYVRLHCENQEIQTKETLNCIWNEVFTFNISKGISTLDVEVYEKYKFLSSVKIPFSALKDQMKAEQELELTNSNGE